MNPVITSFQTTAGNPSLKKRNQSYLPIRQKALLYCGIGSSLLYVVMNILTATMYAGYSSVHQTVSELSAIDAPTRPLWVVLAIVYTLLVIAFAAGVWQSATNRTLRITGGLLFVYGFIGFFWPPMHQREVLAMGGGTLTDTMHIAFAIVTIPLMILAIGFGAVSFGKRFRSYSIITLVTLVFFGMLTGLDGPKIAANLPTPWIGVWERINIGAFLLWVIVLAIVLLRGKKKSFLYPVSSSSSTSHLQPLK